MDGPTSDVYQPARAVDWWCQQKNRRPNQSVRKPYKPRARKSCDNDNFVERFWAGELDDETDEDVDFVV